MHRDKTAYEQMPCQPDTLKSTSTDRPTSKESAKNAGRFDSAEIAQFNPVSTRELLPYSQKELFDAQRESQRSINSELHSKSPITRLSRPTFVAAPLENSTAQSVKPKSQPNNEKGCLLIDGPALPESNGPESNGPESNGPESNGRIDWKRIRSATTQPRRLRIFFLADWWTSNSYFSKKLRRCFTFKEWSRTRPPCAVIPGTLAIQKGAFPIPQLPPMRSMPRVLGLKDFA